jgi:hypothetical protein
MTYSDGSAMSRADERLYRLATTMAVFWAIVIIFLIGVMIGAA